MRNRTLLDFAPFDFLALMTLHLLLHTLADVALLIARLLLCALRIFLLAALLELRLAPGLLVARLLFTNLLIARLLLLTLRILLLAALLELRIAPSVGVARRRAIRSRRSRWTRRRRHSRLRAALATRSRRSCGAGRV